MKTLGKYLVMAGIVGAALVLIVRYGVDAEERDQRTNTQAAAAVASAQKADRDQDLRAWKAQVAAKTIIIGMPADYVRQSWGEPQAIDRTTTARHVTEKWVYSEGTAVLAFEDGILHVIQDARRR